MYLLLQYIVKIRRIQIWLTNEQNLSLFLFPFLSPLLSLCCQPRYTPSVTSFSFYFPSPSFHLQRSLSRERPFPLLFYFAPRTRFRPPIHLFPPFNWLRSHLWPPLSLFRGCSPRGVTAPSTVTNDPVEFRGVAMDLSHVRFTLPPPP